MIYNVDQKEKFIQDCIQSDDLVRQVTHIFNRIGDIENKYNMDFCYMTDKRQVIEVASLVSGNKSRGVTNKIKLLEKYINWCRGHYTNVSRVIEDIKAEDVNIEYLKLHAVPNPQELENYMNRFLRSNSDNSMDIVYRCVFWIAYSGIDKHVICDIKKDDVNLTPIGDEFFVIYKGIEYPVPAIALDTFERCVKSRWFYFYNNKYKTGFTNIDRVQGDGLLRGIRNASGSYIVYSNAIEKKANSAGILDKRISYSSAMLSGFFYRLNRIERSGSDIDFFDAAKRSIGDKEYNFSKSRSTINGKTGAIAKEIKTDYENWKKAFNL